ncbi:hypothetical protein VTO73DRAFT_5958 [Trametes versicolor]
MFVAARHGYCDGRGRFVDVENATQRYVEHHMSRSPADGLNSPSLQDAGGARRLPMPLTTSYGQDFEYQASNSISPPHRRAFNKRDVPNICCIVANAAIVWMHSTIEKTALWWPVPEFRT